MQTSKVIDSLGGCRVVADLMQLRYLNVKRWYDKNQVPAHRRIEFVKMAGKNGVNIKVADLAEV